MAKINFESFVTASIVIVPILNNEFQYNRKRYVLKDQISSGWYEVSISGNEAKVVNPYFIETIDFSKIKGMVIKGYTYNNSLIPFNFDNAKRKFNMDVMTELNFNNSPTFSSIEAIMWEDKKLYYYRPNYFDSKIHEVSQNCLSDGTGDLAGIKGVTPEMKTVFLFHAIERIQIQKLQEEAERRKEEEDFKKSLPGRLWFAFNSVGAEIANYSVEGNRIVVDWKLPTGQEFNSVIDSNTFRVIEAGYCMSGDDKRHSVQSMVLTAEEWDKKRKIHKTRYRDSPADRDFDEEFDEDYD